MRKFTFILLILALVLPLMLSSCGENGDVSSESVPEIIDLGPDTGALYSEFTSVTSEDGKKVLRIFSEKQFEEYSAIRSRGERISLKRSEVDYLFDDAARIYNTYDRIILTGVTFTPLGIKNEDTVIEPYRGDYTEFSHRGARYKYYEELHKITLIGLYRVWMLDTGVTEVFYRFDTKGNVRCLFSLSPIDMEYNDDIFPFTSYIYVDDGGAYAPGSDEHLEHIRTRAQNFNEYTLVEDPDYKSPSKTIDFATVTCEVRDKTTYQGCSYGIGIFEKGSMNYDYVIIGEDKELSERLYSEYELRKSYFTAAEDIYIRAARYDLDETYAYQYLFYLDEAGKEELLSALGDLDALIESLGEENRNVNIGQNVAFFEIVFDRDTVLRIPVGHGGLANTFFQGTNLTSLYQGGIYLNNFDSVYCRSVPESFSEYIYDKFLPLLTEEDLISDKPLFKLPDALAEFFEGDKPFYPAYGSIIGIREGLKRMNGDLPTLDEFKERKEYPLIKERFVTGDLSGENAAPAAKTLLAVLALVEAKDEAGYTDSEMLLSARIHLAALCETYPEIAAEYEKCGKNTAQTFEKVIGDPEKYLG